MRTPDRYLYLAVGEVAEPQAGPVPSRWTGRSIRLRVELAPGLHLATGVDICCELENTWWQLPPSARSELISRWIAAIDLGDDPRIEVVPHKKGQPRFVLRHNGFVLSTTATWGDVWTALICSARPGSYIGEPRIAPRLPRLRAV